MECLFRMAFRTLPRCSSRGWRRRWLWSTNASTGECRELASCRTSGEAQLGVSLESHDVLTSASTNVFELGAGEVVLEDLMGS